LGNAVDQYNEIDAVKLTSPPEAQNTQIDYNYVINKPTSSTVHSVESSSGAHLSMDLEGNTPVEITALRTKITPKFSHSSLSISANIMACAQIGHIFSISIYINGAPYSPSTPSTKHIDALVPVPTRGADESLLNSVFGEIKAIHGNNTDEVTVGVFVYYHKDVDATERTANVSINRAKITIKGVASTLVGTSVLKVTEID
jgi:hypothetical protein